MRANVNLVKLLDHLSIQMGQWGVTLTNSTTTQEQTTALGQEIFALALKMPCNRELKQWLKTDEKTVTSVELPENSPSVE